MSDPTALIVLPRLQIQNANAISGPLTWGFPSPTAFAGFIHALERRLKKELEEGFGGVGIVCHKFEPQVSKPAGKYTHVFQLTRNPLSQREEKNKISTGGNISPPSFVEEGRTHIEVSLVFALLDYLDEEDSNALIKKLMGIVHTLRLAGGSILPQRVGKRFNAQYWPLALDKVGQDETFRKLRRSLLPGFALVQREDYLQARLAEMQEQDSQANALDALLDLSRLNIEPYPSNSDAPDEIQWGIRKHPGWLVPVPVGYAAISPLYKAGEVRNARDNETPFRFVENLYSLGEWVSPHRITTAEQILWHQHADVEKGIYRCINHYVEHLPIGIN